MRVYNYGTLKKFRPGITLIIVLSFKCNMDCSYCICKMPNGSYPTFMKEKTLDEWKEFINTFPVKIKEVILTGGETLLNDLTIPFMNWLMDNGCFVQLQTNLSINVYRVQLITNSIRLRVITTYHRGEIKKEEYLENYHFLRDTLSMCEIKVNGLGKKDFRFSRFKKWCEIKSLQTIVKNRIFVGPDFQIFRSCFETYNSYTK